MLSIGEFSFLSRLSPQALRFYHSEGLLVPAVVDERTGYRSYRLDQVDRALLISVLRGTGMSVKLVRRAVDEPGAASALLKQHVTELEHRRKAEDEAISDARAFLTAWPEPRRVHAPATTVVSARVPVPAPGKEWPDIDAACDAATAGLVRAVEACGAVVSGTPWRSWAMAVPDLTDGSGFAEPHPWVTVPVTADESALAALPDDVEVRTVEARDELAIIVPGRSSAAKVGTALSRLLAHPLEDAVADLSRLRQLPHPDGTEITVAIAAAVPGPVEQEFPDLTGRAHTVLRLAVDQAREQSSPTVGTGHLLDGVIGEGANLALAVLRAAGIDPAEVRRDLAHRTAEPDGSHGAASSPWSAAATRALTLARTEAAARGSAYVGCEHLLLGLLGETEGTAGHVLRTRGAELGAARRILIAALDGHRT